MATNIEQIFRSFVVNKFKEIQEEGKLSSENSESSQNEELSAQKAENTSESSASCPQSEGTAQTTQDETTKTDELAKPVNSAVETDSPPKELKPAEVISDDEVKRGSSKKKSKKHKKHKSKKKKKKKKKEKHEKRSKSVSSIEDQENVNLEEKSVWKPAFASPPKEQSQLNALLSTKESTDVAAQSSQSILEANLSCAQEDRLPGLQLDVDSGFFGPKCPNEISINISSNSSSVCCVDSRPSCEESNLTAQQRIVSPASENDLGTAKSQHSEALYPRSPEAKCIRVNNLDVDRKKDSLHTDDISGSMSKSKDKSRSSSKSPLRQQRSRSRSLIKVPKSRHSSTKSPKIRQQSRSSSRDQRKRSHSKSGQRQRSCSKSPGRRRRSQSRTSARYSKSPIKSWWSKSLRNWQRSVSVTRRRKSKTRSPARRCKSRTRSPENRHGSRTRSRSPGRRRKSRSTSRKFRPRSKSPKRDRSDSRSLSRRRRSASHLGSRRQRSRSGSSPRRQKSKSGSAARRRRSGSNTEFKRRRSRSVSLARRRRSRSASLVRRRKSRSTSLARRRKSRSTSLARRRRSTSQARRRRSVSAGRKRKSRSTSLVRRRRSRSISPVRRRRSRSASVRRRRSRRSSRSASPARRRRSKSPSPARRHRTKSASSSRRRRSRSASTVRRRRSRSDSSMKRHISKSSSPVRRQRSISISRRQKSAERLERSSPKAAVKRQSPRNGSVAKTQSSRSSSANRRPSKGDSVSHRRKSRSTSTTRKQSQSTARNKSPSRSVERKDRSRSRSTEVRNPGLRALNEKLSDSSALVQENINNEVQATCKTSDINLKPEISCSESKTSVTELLEPSSGNQNVTDSSVKSSCHQILPSGKASVTEPLTSPCALVEPYKIVEQPVAANLHGDPVASDITGVLHPPCVISPDIAEERSCDLIQKPDLVTGDTGANRATMSLKTDATNPKDLSDRFHPAASDKQSINECEFANQTFHSDNHLQSSSFEAEGSVSTIKSVSNQYSYMMDSVPPGKEAIHSSPLSNLFESSKNQMSKSGSSKNSKMNIPPSTCSLSYAELPPEYSSTLVEGASSASSSNESKSVSVSQHHAPLTNYITLELGIKPNPDSIDTSTNLEPSFSSLAKSQKSTLKGQLSSVFNSQVYSSSNRLLKDDDLSSNFSLRNADETVLQNCTETTENDESCNDDQKAMTVVPDNSAKICSTDITVKSVEASSYLTDQNLSSKHNEACSSENKWSYKLGIQYYQDKRSSEAESSLQAEATLPQLHLETKLHINPERTPESAETCELLESQDQKDVILQDSRLSPDQNISTTFTAHTSSAKKNELEVLQPTGPHQSNYNSSEKNREFLLASSKPLFVEHQRYDEMHVDTSKDKREASSATKHLQTVEHVRIPKNKNERETIHVQQEPIFAPSGKISPDTPKTFYSIQLTSQKQQQIQEYELPESTLKKPANENRVANKHSNVKKNEDGRSEEAAILSRDSHGDIDKFSEGNVNIDQETCLPISLKAGSEITVTKDHCTDVLSKHVEEVTLEIDNKHNQKSEEHHKKTYLVSRTESISNCPGSTEAQKESKPSMHENQKPSTAGTVQFKFSKTFKTLPSSQICNTSDESSDKETSKVSSSSPSRTLSSSALLSSLCVVSSKSSTKLPQNVLQQEQLEVPFEPLKLDILSNTEQGGNDVLQQDGVQATDDTQSSGTIKPTFPHLSNASSKLGVKQRQYRSRSVAQDSRSPSVDRGKTSRSRSKSTTRKRCSRSKSVSKKKRSQSSSRKKSSHSKSSKRKPSRSKSRGRKRRSQSKSKSKKKHSPSKSSGKRKRSRSKSTEAIKSVGKQGSRSKSKTRRKQAQSKSPDGRSRSKSATRKSSHSKSTDIRKNSQSKSLSSRSRSRSASASRIHISRTKALLHRKRSSSGSKSKSPRRRSLSKNKGRSHSRSPAQRHQSRSRSRTSRKHSRSRRWRRSRSLSMSRRRSRSSSRTSHSLSTKKRRSVSKSPTHSRRSRSQVKQKDKSPLSKRKSTSPLPQKKTIQSKAAAFKHSIGLKSLIQKQLSQAKSQGSGGKLSNKEHIPLSTIAARAQLSASTFSSRAQVSTSSLTTVPQISVPNLAEVPLPSEPGSGQVTVPSLPPADQLPVTGIAAEAAVPVPDLSNAAQWHVPDISSGAQWPVPDITAGTQWSISDMTAGAPWPMADLAASSHWPMHDLTMGAQWNVPDLAAGTPWAVPDVATGAQWTVPDLTASTHWTVPDLTAGSQWAMTNLAPGAQWAVPDLAATAQWAVPDLTSGTHIQSADLAPEAQVPGSDLTAEAQVPGSDLGTEAQVPGSDLAAEAQVPGSDLVSEAQVPVQDNVADGSDNELVSEGLGMMPDVAAEALVPVANGTLVPDVAAGIPLPDVTAAAQIPVPDVAATAHMPVPDVATTAQSLMSDYAVARSFRTVHESMFDSSSKPPDYSDLSSTTVESADRFCVKEKLVSAEQLESETLNRTVQETILESSTSIADVLPCEASSKHAVVPEISASPLQEETTLNSESHLNDNHYSTSSLTSEPCLQPDTPLLTDTANHSSSTDVLYGSHDDDNCPFLPTSDASNPLLIDSNIESSSNLLLEPCVSIVEPYASPDHTTLVESYSSPDHSLLIEPYCSPDHALLVTEFSGSEHPLLTEPQVVSDPLELTDSCASPGPFSKAEDNSNIGHSPQESVVHDISSDCHQLIEHNITTLPFSEPEECFNSPNQSEPVEPYASPSCHKSTKLNADLDIPQLVEPYTSPEHPQIVEAYSSPEHLPLVEPYNSPECPQLVEPYNSPPCPKLVEPYGSPESQDLTESFDNPVHPQLVQLYTSPEHSQLVQPCVSPEHPQLVQQFASPKNLQLVQTYASSKLPQLVQAYVSPEHPQLDEPYTSPEHPQLVQAYASPEHPQLVQQYASPEYPQLVQPYGSPEHPQVVQTYDSPEHLEQVQSYTNPEDHHPVQSCAKPEDLEVVQACASPEHLKLVETCASTEQPQLADASSSLEKPQLVEACSKPAHLPLPESCASPESPQLAEACASPEHPQLVQRCASLEQQQLVQTYSDPHDSQLVGSYTSPDHPQLVQPFSIPNVVDICTSSERLHATLPYTNSDSLELVQPYDSSGHLQLTQPSSPVCVQQVHPSVSPEKVQIIEKDVTPECIYGDQIASPDHPQIVQQCESSLELNQPQASEEYQQFVQSYFSPKPPQLTESEDSPDQQLPVESFSSSDQTPATVSNSGPDLPVNVDSDESSQLIQAALPEVRFEPSPGKHDKAGPLPEETICSVVQNNSRENSPTLSVLEDCYSNSVKIQSKELFSGAHKSLYNDPFKSSDHVVSKEDCSDSAQYLTVHYNSGTVQCLSEDEHPFEKELCSLEPNALPERTELTKPHSFPDLSESEECFRSASVPHLDRVCSSGGQALSDASVHITAQPSAEEQSATTSQLLKGGGLNVPDVEEPAAVLDTSLHLSEHSIMPLSDEAKCSEATLPDRSLSTVIAHSNDRAVLTLEQEEKVDRLELQKTSDVTEQHLANKTPHPSECDSLDILATEAHVLLEKSYSSPVHSLHHKILESDSYPHLDKSSFSPSQSVQENSLSSAEQKGVWDVTGEIHSERVYSKGSPILNNPEKNDIPALADPVLDGAPLKSSQPLSPEQDYHRSVEAPLSADLPLLSHDTMKSFTLEQVSALSVEAEIAITEDSGDLGLDHQYKTPPPDLLPFDSEQPSYLFPNSESLSEPVLFNSQQPPELLPYDSEQPTNHFQSISDFSSEQDSSVFHTPPELLPYDSEQSTELLKSTPESSEEKMPVYKSEDLSNLPSDIVSPTSAPTVNQVYLDINPDSIPEVDTPAIERVSLAEKRVNDGQPSTEANDTPIILSNELSDLEYNSKSSKVTPTFEKQHSEASEVLSVKPLPMVDSVHELSPSEFLCEQTLCLSEQRAVPNTTPQPLTEKEVCVEQAQLVSEDFLESVLPLCTEECKTDKIPLLSNLSSSFEVQTSSGDSGNLSQQEEPPLTQLHTAMDLAKKRSRSKSLTKSEIPQSQSTSTEKESHSKSTNSTARSRSQSKARKKSRSKSTTRKKRSRSRSATRVKKSRSKSVVKTRRSRSKSTAKRKKSRSASGTRRRKSRSWSVSRKRRSRSTSIAHKQSSRSSSIARRRRSRSSRRKRSHSSSLDHKRSHSHSVVRRKHSRSPSVARRRRSRTRSPLRRRRSRSSSITRRRHSRSSSVVRRRRSRSSSITRRRHSRSSSVSRRRHSPSLPSARRRRSPSPPLSRWRRSRSPSSAHRRRSRSVSRKKRSCSPSASHKRRSPSATRRRRSRTPSAPRRKRSPSTSRKRHSRSSSATRKRLSRSVSVSKKKRSRSLSASRKIRSRTPSIASKRKSESKSPTPKSPKNTLSKSDRSRSRSQSNATRKRKSHSRSLSRDKSKANEKRRKRSSSKEHYSTKQRRKSRTPPRRKKSRSPARRASPCRSPVRRRRSRSPVRRKSFSRSPVRRKRSRSRDQSMDSARSPKRLTDLDKAQLLEIAKANAAAMCAKAGVPLPLSLKPVVTPAIPTDDKVTQRTYGTSIQELTEKCKQIAQSKEDDEVVNKPHDSDEDEEDKPFYNHPFKVTEHKPISFSLLNPNLKTAPKTQVTLTKEFPVSSGSQHRKKEDKVYGEWVPVDKKTEDGKDDVFTTPAPSQPVDITAAMNERAIAQTRLTGNPFDLEALLLLNRAQEQIDTWAQSSSLPGQFTGSTGAQVLSPDEISNSGPQAWLKKDQFLKAAPVTGGRGALLMRKMGWKEGEGLGRNNEGNVDPILLDFKTDRKGLVADGEKASNKLTLPAMKDLSGKHPISVLMELCNKKKWSPPDFTLVDDTGPDHRKRFLFRVTCNGVTCQPSQPSVTKKLAKATAAAAALQALGALPKENKTSTTNFCSASTSVV